MADEHEAYVRSSRAFHQPRQSQDHHQHQYGGNSSDDGSITEDDDHYYYEADDDDNDNNDEIHIVQLDDEYKRQLCLGAVDTLANSLAFQNWLNATKYISPKDNSDNNNDKTNAKAKKRMARIWKIDTTNTSNQEMIISWKKISTKGDSSSTYRRRHIKYDGHDSDESDSDDESDIASSDDEDYDYDTTTIKLEYFTVATQSNISNTVKLVHEDLLKNLPPSAPTSTKKFIKNYSNKLLRADTHLFNALSCTLMISGALSSSSRSTISNTNQELSKGSIHRKNSGSGSGTTMLMNNPVVSSSSNTKKHHARRWAHFAFPVNRNHDGFQYILVDISPICCSNDDEEGDDDDSIDVSLNSVVNATFATNEKLVIHDMITSVKTCLTKRNIIYEEKKLKDINEEDHNENDDDWPIDPSSANNTILLCKQGLVNISTNNNSNNNSNSASSSSSPVSKKNNNNNSNGPTAMTQFEFDQYGNLQDIGLSFG